MSNFYKRFIQTYCTEMGAERSSLRVLFGNRSSRVTKMISFYEKIVDSITRKLSKNKVSISLVYKNNYFIDNLEQFEVTYNSLCDENSKTRFIQYIVFKAINSTGLKFPTGHMDASIDIKSVSKLTITDDFIKGYTNIGNLNLYDLSPIGYDVKLINESVGTLIDFVYEQYAYRELFGVKKDDVVIDCGGAIGDTAIYFAAKGASSVYVFEFIRSNIALINKQIELNPSMETKIKVIEKAVWNESKVELSYLDKGNSSSVADAGVYPDSTTTLSIDDMVLENKLEHVDMIKMDIEGAESPALMGAQDTIRKFKPKLAICVYHKNSDLVKIPNYIKSLNPDYDFYFEYYTDVGWEAVLYAVNREET